MALTEGQPWLVNALANKVVAKMKVPVSETITVAHLEEAAILAADSQSPPLKIRPLTLKSPTLGELFAIHVMQGLTWPVFIRDRSPWGGNGCFKRSGGSTLSMTDDEIRELLSRSRSLSLDDTCVNDVGQSSARRTFKEVIS